MRHSGHWSAGWSPCGFPSGWWPFLNQTPHCLRPRHQLHRDRACLLTAALAAAIGRELEAAPGVSGASRVAFSAVSSGASASSVRAPRMQVVQVAQARLHQLRRRRSGSAHHGRNLLLKCLAPVFALSGSRPGTTWRPRGQRSRCYCQSSCLGSCARLIARCRTGLGRSRS